jgi:hypothetical protein
MLVGSSVLANLWALGKQVKHQSKAKQDHVNPNFIRNHAMNRSIYVISNVNQ